MSHGPSQAQGLIGRETPDSLVQPAYLRAYAANPNQVFSGKRLVSYVAGLPRKPGWVYSSTNYVLAQMIIERVTHDSYADQLRRRIITPGPAQHVPRRTSLPARGDLPAPGRLLLHISPGVAGTVLAVCHRPEPLHGVGAGLGRIVSSPPDVTKWARALFTGRELPRKQQRELESLISTKTGEPIKPLPVGQDPDALRTTDAALIVMTYTVLRAGSPDVTEAGDKRKAPDPGRIISVRVRCLRRVRSNTIGSGASFACAQATGWPMDPPITSSRSPVDGERGERDQSRNGVLQRRSQQGLH